MFLACSPLCVRSSTRQSVRARAKSPEVPDAGPIVSSKSRCVHSIQSGVNHLVVVSETMCPWFGDCNSTPPPPPFPVEPFPES